MQTRLKTRLILSLSACILMIVTVTVAAWLVQGQSPVGSPLESAVSRVPLGITAAEADAIVGNTPDEVSESEGVLMNPVTMLSSTNSRARNYGEPQTYSLRTWREDDLRATIAIGADGKVAGHWTWEE